MRRTGQQNALRLGKTHCLNDFRLFRRTYIGIGLVKFRIARHRHEFRRRAQTHDVIGINIRLHGKLRHRTNHIGEQAVQIFILLHAAVTDTAIDHHHRNVHLAGRLQEIRP